MVAAAHEWEWECILLQDHLGWPPSKGNELFIRIVSYKKVEKINEKNLNKS